ncbi:MAG: isoprenylcysteine carboxylmethyltransferase family protein [Candidatus Kapaibacterium sp.]
MPLKEEFRTQGNFLFKHRSYLPLIIVAVGLAVYMYTLNATNTTLEQFNNYKIELIFLLVALIGQFIRAYSVGFAAKNTSGRNTSVGQVADSLNSTGIYSIVRHPLYLGNFFMWLGIALFTANFWFIMAFLFMYWLYYERIMYAEEEFLREKYGSAYVEWAEKTPAIIPCFKKWVKPDGTFSLWKVIKQEKSGILNVFLTIFLFKVIAGYVLYEDFSIIQNIWTWALVGAAIYYTIVKIVQKTGKSS